jgi:FemAB-related protein (PEP-CTERM system-associated)
MPFFDSGGLLVNDKDTGRRILNKTMQIARELNVTSIELRHTHSLSLMEEANQAEDTDKDLSAINRRTEVHSTKVRMLLELPDSPSILMKSFKSKLRSQIRKPIKEGLTTKIGGLDLLNDFYEVFCINMRDLGSPVHSRKLIENVLLAFSDQAKVVMVYKERKPLAGSVVVGFMDTLENPWSSSLRQYSKLSPNMLLYWTMLEYACENGYRFFDFGRSSPEEGTYKFKKQWGAKSEPLHWYTTHLKDIPLAGTTPDKSKFERAISYWQKLPVWVTKALGPRIRKYISL